MASPNPSFADDNEESDYAMHIVHADGSVDHSYGYEIFYNSYESSNGVCQVVSMTNVKIQKKHGNSPVWKIVE